MSPQPSETPTPEPTRAPTEQPPTSTPVVQTPTAEPAPTSTPTSLPAEPTPAPRVWTSWGRITIDTYPFADFLREERDSTYDMPFLVLNRAAYEASAPTPSPKAYQALHVENEFLRLTFLPELGGRLYQCLFKPTSQALFYNNAVIKPSYWGPSPREQNWWLAAGGLEWAFPVQEHGYFWGVPWQAEVEAQGDRIIVILRDTTEPGRLRAEVRVSLAAGEARFTVEPRLINGTSRTVPVQFWANAMLAPGAGSVGPGLRFVFPSGRVIVHSRGDASLPAEREVMPWPVVGGRDLSRYEEWRNWLGAFAAEPLPGQMGLYNTVSDFGVARIVSGGMSGLKLFGFGSEFGDAPTFTDNGRTYVELWAGANRTFWPEDDRMLAPGESLGWQEVWLPVASVGGYTAATENGVLTLQQQGGKLRIAAASPVARRVMLALVAGASAVRSWSLALEPGRPFVEEILLDSLGMPSERLRLQMSTEDGMLLAQTSP